MCKSVCAREARVCTRSMRVQACMQGEHVWESLRVHGELRCASVCVHGKEAGGSVHVNGQHTCASVLACVEACT